MMTLQGVEFAGLEFKPEQLVQVILAKTPGNTWDKSMLHDLSMTLEEKTAIAEKAEQARLKKEAEQKAEQDAMNVELGTLMGTSELERGTSHGSSKSAESKTSGASGGSATGKKPKKKRAKKSGTVTRCSDCIIKDIEKEVMIKDLAAHIATIAALEADNATIRDLNKSCTQENNELHEELERLREANAVTTQMDDMGMDSTGMDSTIDGDGNESAYESPDE
jgi:hypothetical protein